MRTAGASGVDIAYEVTGHGPPVICIQGVGVIGAGWRPQVETLARQFRIITFDQPRNRADRVRLTTSDD